MNNRHRYIYMFVFFHYIVFMSSVLSQTKELPFEICFEKKGFYYENLFSTDNTGLIIELIKNDSLVGKENVFFSSSQDRVKSNLNFFNGDFLRIFHHVADTLTNFNTENKVFSYQLPLDVLKQIANFSLIDSTKIIKYNAFDALFNPDRAFLLRFRCSDDIAGLNYPTLISTDRKTEFPLKQIEINKKLIEYEFTYSLNSLLSKYSKQDLYLKSGYFKYKINIFIQKEIQFTPLIILVSALLLFILWEVFKIFQISKLDKKIKEIKKLLSYLSMSVHQIKQTNLQDRNLVESLNYNKDSKSVKNSSGQNQNESIPVDSLIIAKIKKYKIDERFVFVNGVNYDSVQEFKTFISTIAEIFSNVINVVESLRHQVNLPAEYFKFNPSIIEPFWKAVSEIEQYRSVYKSLIHLNKLNINENQVNYSELYKYLNESFKSNVIIGNLDYLLITLQKIYHLNKRLEFKNINSEFLESLNTLKMYEQKICALLERFLSLKPEEINLFEPISKYRKYCKVSHVVSAALYYPDVKVPSGTIIDILNWVYWDKETDSRIGTALVFITE